VSLLHVTVVLLRIHMALEGLLIVAAVHAGLCVWTTFAPKRKKRK
jgi:hypothetical protein